MEITATYGRDISENIFISNISKNLSVIDTNFFQNSKYIDIIRIIGENVNPIKYSDIKDKTGLVDSTLSRSLIWLQNIVSENGLKSDEVEAYSLKKEAYVESTGIPKSKNNRYRLTKQGNDMFNSLFLEAKEVSAIDDLIQDFRIFEKLWNFVDNNRDIFYNQFDDELQPWTYQIFEFFEDLNETEINNILNAISGPLNLKLFNLFEVITTLIFTHPLWKNNAKEKWIDFPEFNESHLSLFNEIPQFKLKFQFFGAYPVFNCIIKSDRLIKEMHSSIERHIKIYYWKGIKYYTHEETIRKTIERNVFNDLYEVCSEYLEFIDQFHIEISIHIKNIIEEKCSSEVRLAKSPFNLLSPQIQEKYEFYLRRKIFLSEIEAVPSQLLKLGASKKIIYEQLEILKQKSDLEPEDFKLKLKLLELLVYNYSNEFRTDYVFYDKFKIDLISYVEDLIEVLITSDSEYQERALILAYIFYNQKYLIGEKAICISELLLNLYPEEEVLYENLLYLYYRQTSWSMKKIKDITNKALKLELDNSIFTLSNTIIKLVENKPYSIQKFKADIFRILEINATPERIIQDINFFVNQLNKHNLNDLSLKLLEESIKRFNNPELKRVYAENLLNNKKYSKAIEEFLRLIDIFPNKLLEGRVLTILSNRLIQIPDLKEHEELNKFLIDIINLLNLMSKSYEWDISESKIKDFQEKREEHLSILRIKLKEINSLLKNKYCLTLPLKIKAIILKALDRDNNLESCLSKILIISPNNKWANTEIALLLFKQKQYEKSFKLLEYVNELKERGNYSSSYYFFPFSYLLKENDYNIFRLHKKAGEYHDAILIMEEFLLNPYSQEDIKINATEIGKDLIYCYSKITKNTNEIIEKTLILADKIDGTKEENSNIINVQKDSSYIRQCSIDYLFNEQQYSKCLELILGLSKKHPNILEPSSSFFTPFNKNIFYLAECYLKLNNLILAKKYYEQSLGDLHEDITFGGKTNILLIQPFPDYLKINKKELYLNRIENGLKKINKLLAKESLLEKLIFKTNIERSIGNISLLIRERANREQNLFEVFQNQLISISEDERNYYEIILACSYAITGYIDEMFKLINKGNSEKSYSIVSTLLKILYYYYEIKFDKYNELNIRLHGLIPNSSIPLLLNLHFLRFKKTNSKIYNLTNLFKTIWRINHNKTNIHGIEKQIIKYFINNLTWYPFKWALNCEEYLKTLDHEDTNLILTILDFIENKPYDTNAELIEFITRVLSTTRRIKDFLKLLITSRTYKFPETKYFILMKLNPDIGEYGLNIYGKIAYKAYKLHEYIHFIDKYKNKEIKQLKKIKFTNGRRNWLEEQYLELLLTSFKNYEFKNKIEEGLRFLKVATDYSQEKIKYFEILLSIREKHYEDARINAFRLLKFSKEDLNSKFSRDIFKIWVLSKLLSNLNKKLKLKSSEFSNDIEEIIDYKNSTKNLFDYQLVIIDVLNHELLENFKEEIFVFGKELFISIQNSIDWNNNKSLELLCEKIYFNKEIVIEYSLDIISVLDKLSTNIKPSNFSFEVRKNYLYYIKAMIYFKNDMNLQAKKVLETVFDNMNENEIYTTYQDIIDQYLEVMSDSNIS